MQLIRTNAAHLAAIEGILDTTGLFPPDMLGGMIAPFLESSATDFWLTCEDMGEPVGFLYLAAEPLTDRTWNMRAIAVRPDRQGEGIGRFMLRAVEDHLRDQRLIVVDTSGTDAFARTRSFYRSNGYDEEARIRDFWEEGDDKVTFRRAL